jgi:hypothetical protein
VGFGPHRHAARRLQRAGDVTRDPNRSLINAAKRGNADAHQLAAMLATGDGIEEI